MASAAELTDIVCEFLEVAIHLLLHVRNIYPAELFERRRHFNVPVQWIRHPELRDYVHSAVAGLHSWFQQGHVEQVEVVFLDAERAPVEKFVFKVSLSSASAAPVPVNDIEYALRGFLIKLSMSEPLLRPLPENCSFEIVAYSVQLPGDATEKGRFWIPSEPLAWDHSITISPIKSMQSIPLNLQLYIEHPSNL